MTFEVFWRLPVHGDGRTIDTERWNRGDYSPDRRSPHPFARTGPQRDGYTYYDHLAQIARAAEHTGFDGLWLPHTASGEEPLIVAGALAREARRSKLVVSFRAPLLSAVYSTKIAVSFQRLTGGRLAWHLSVEEDGERPWHGRRWGVGEQLARTGELLDVARGFWHKPSFSYKGQYYEVENGGFAPALQGETFPLVYLSDGPEDAQALSARHADVHLLPLDEPAVVRARVEALGHRAAALGRRLRFGIEADVFARPTRQAAWDELRRQWRQACDTTVPISSATPVRALPEFDELLTGDHLWKGFGWLRPGAAQGLVGGYDDLAQRLADYARAGITTFVFAANPGLEEAYRVGEQLLSRARPLFADLRRVAL
ncbi:MAG: LLM class flavin-dependent oxidoreductase [Polyangiaceae bacterium]|nr:LLM class flavin-dependent oxidoreductase [Polyangiaceae bacterium]